MRHEPRRTIKEVKASTKPNLGDSSTPKYADHNDHVFAVYRALGGRGFPYFDIPPVQRRKWAA